MKFNIRCPKCRGAFNLQFWVTLNIEYPHGTKRTAGYEQIVIECPYCGYEELHQADEQEPVE